ncbi:7665_t:CDS:2 [Acaulospora morrowiae]|uniref:7665_t:CDS:1 n=1 Tax=Acaulospora morrowiae TaxID=94023 RepID=A0A9N9FLV6_9GLOM|nr:7665_t:CDS:2 [Acaulospora morrowiae]
MSDIDNDTIEEIKSTKEFATENETAPENPESDDTIVEMREILDDLKLLDLFHSQHTRAPHLIQGRIAYFLYAWRAIRYIFVAFYMDWTVVIRHPLNFILIAISLVVSTVLLGILGIFITIYSLLRWSLFLSDSRSKELNGYGLLKEEYEKYRLACSKYGKYKPCDKHDRECKGLRSSCQEYNDYIDNLKSGMKLLGNGDSNEKQVRKNYQVYNKIEMLLFLASIVYQREKAIIHLIHENINDLKKVHRTGSEELKEKVYEIVKEQLGKVKNIVDEYEKVEKLVESGNVAEKEEDSENVLKRSKEIKKKLKENHFRLIFLTFFLNLSTFSVIMVKITQFFIRKFFPHIKAEDGMQKENMKSIKDSIKGLVRYNERQINNQLKKIHKGLEFTSISELNTADGGSFCGMFYNDDENFIVVSFKGTSPTNFGEWISNLTFQCVDARGFLYGQVHRGFYNYLFPLDEKRSAKGFQSYPSSRITRAIGRKAKDIRIDKTYKNVLDFCKNKLAVTIDENIKVNEDDEKSDEKSFWENLSNVIKNESFWDNSSSERIKEFSRDYVEILSGKQDDDHMVKEILGLFFDLTRPQDPHKVGLINNFYLKEISDYVCRKFINNLKKVQKVNLWITGHSLGGGLATLFYARLLKVNLGELKNVCKLRDTVTFASPAVGDIHFAAELSSLKNDPANEDRPLWRIVLKRDIVPKLPHRACDKGLRKYGYHYNVLMNYVQVGDKVIFKSDGSFAKLTCGKFVKEIQEPYADRELFLSKDNLEDEIERCVEKYYDANRALRNTNRFRKLLNPCRIVDSISQHFVGSYIDTISNYRKKERKSEEVESGVEIKS